MNSQQTKILKISKRLERKYKNDFSGWVRDYISFTGLCLKDLTHQQKEIADFLIKDKNICVSAGGGIGKTALAALSVLWFLSTHPHAKVPTTAPTAKQLNDVLWSEISLWLNRCKIRDIFVSRKGKIHIKHFPEWYAVARTVPRDGKNLNDTLAGFHAPHLMILVDEASGVPDPVFTALEGAMTDENSHIFLISNPVSSGGYYYDTITDPEGKGSSYRVLYYDSRESELVDDSYAERIIERYGKDSPMYIAKVLGKPVSADKGAVVTPDRFDAVVKENKETLDGAIVMGIDVGGGGNDPTVFCHRKGMSFPRWDELATGDPDAIVDYAISLYFRLWPNANFTCVIDAGGLGWGPYNMLKKKAPFKVLPFIGSEHAIERNMFRNERTEGYYTIYKEFESFHFPTTPPSPLKKELANLFIDMTAEPMEMEPKRKMIARIGSSPNYADAMMMSLYSGSLMAMSSNPQVPAKTARAMSKLKLPDRKTKFGQFKKFIV